MSQWDQWVYRKYRFDHHFFYKDVAPPPIEMWMSGIFDINSVAAQQWFHDRNITEMMDEWSDSSSEEQTTAPPPPHSPTGEHVNQQCTGPMDKVGKGMRNPVK